MYIGGMDMAHHYLQQPLRLVWAAKAFRRPSSVSVSLAPHQYVVQCMVGPLLRPVQQTFSWEGKRVLSDGWRAQQVPLIHALQKYKADSTSDDAARSPRPRGWRRYFGAGGATRGLDSSMHIICLAKRFVIGYRVDAGMWCQTFENGWPLSLPFLITQPSPVGFLVAAELEVEWFRDLPFTREEQWVRDSPFSKNTRELLSSIPRIDFQWHEHDELLDAASLTGEGVRKWL